MLFEPNTDVLKFQKGDQSDAFAFMRQLQGDEPFEGTREVYTIDAMPANPPSKSELSLLPLGPLVVEGVCPSTSRRMHLHVFRDLSAVIVREAPYEDGSIEILPACVTMVSQVYHSTLKETPYDERHKSVPYVKFQSRDGVLRWSMRGMDIPEQEILDLLKASMEDKARLILAAPKVVDPRSTAEIDENTRYAPFSVWREEFADPDAVARLSKAMIAIAGLRSHFKDVGHFSISCSRKSPSEPWRQSQEKNHVRCTTGGGVGSYRVDGPLSSVLMNLVDHLESSLKHCDRYGDIHKKVVEVTNVATPSSSHQRLSCLKALKEIAPNFRYDHLLGDT